MQRNKKAVSQIVTTILIILLVLAAIIIVWNVVKKTVTEQSQNMGAEKFSVSLSTSKVDLSQDPFLVPVTREAGAGNVTAIKIIFKDDKGNSYIYENKTDIPGELETITYSVNRAETNPAITTETNLVSFEVYPIIKTSKEKEIIGIKASRGSVITGKVTSPEYICSAVHTKAYCNQFDGAYSNKPICENAGCNVYELKYCNWADINQDGEVNATDYEIFEIDYNNGRTGCSPEIMPGDIRAWCNGSDINHDGTVSFADYSLLIIPWGSTGCNLLENWEINCYSTLTCSGNAKSSCESKQGCSWIPTSIDCSNPLMQAVWNSTSGILANGAFNRSQNSAYLSIFDNSLKVNGPSPGTHAFQRWVEKDLDNLVSWGGTMYVNLKDVIHGGLVSDVIFVGGYDESGIVATPYSYLRNLVIAAYRENGESYIGMRGYQQSVYAGGYLEGGLFKIVDGSYTNLEDPYTDKWIKIDWFFTSDYRLFAKTSETDWQEVNTRKDDTDPFIMVAFGWISSLSGGSIYIKNVTLYPESCMPEWMAQY